MAKLAGAFMPKYAVLSIVVGYGGAIVYQDAFGFAGQDNRESVKIRKFAPGEIAWSTVSLASATKAQVVELSGSTVAQGDTRWENAQPNRATDN